MQCQKTHLGVTSSDCNWQMCTSMGSLYVHSLTAGDTCCIFGVFYMHCMSAYHPVISDNHSTCNAMCMFGSKISCTT